MKHKILVGALWAVMFFALLGVFVVILILLSPGYGDVPMNSAPSASSAPSTPPTQASSPMPSVTSTPSPTVAPLNDIAGLPVHITIRQGATVLVDTEITTITLDSSGMLVPPAGKAGVYYSPRDWSTIPGNLDTYRGIIAGHDVTGMGAKDVFYNLGLVKKGDVVTLTYRLKSGDLMTAEFAVTADAKSAPKIDVVHAAAYQYLWKPMSESDRYLSILSCDLSQAQPGQHSRNNWIVDTVRTK